MAYSYGNSHTTPVCELHPLEDEGRFRSMEFEQPSLFSTDRGYHEQGGGFFCRDCDKLACECKESLQDIGPWESDPDFDIE